MNIQPKPSAQLQKFENTYEIVEMLEYFKRQHYETMEVLRHFGEGHRCKNWYETSISVKDIQDYIYKKEGLVL